MSRNLAVYAPRSSGFTAENITSHYERDPATECWNWTRAKFECGYGAKTIKGKQFYGHRLSYELHKGPIPDGLVVMHLCDNRACINPAHLRVDTQRENLLDARRKGRLPNYTNQPKGDKHHRAKMSETDIKKIRGLHNEGVSLRAIAASYGMHDSTIGDICKGLTWKHVKS